MAHREADIVINSVRLTFAQSMALRVAVTSFLVDLDDPERMADLGEIGPLYQARLGEVQDIIVDPLNDPQPPAGAGREEG